MSTLFLDLRYAFRAFARNPGFGLAAVVALGLGIGASSAVFSVVDAVLLRPLPYAEPDRLMLLRGSRPQARFEGSLVAPADYLDWRAQSTAFSELGAYTDAYFNLAGGPGPERTRGLLATPSLLEAFGLKPLLGRLFLPAEGEPGAAPVVLVGRGLWTRRFGADPALVGKSLLLNGAQHTVIGVLADELVLPEQRPELLVPYAPDEQQRQNRSGRYLMVVGRLRPEADLARARAEMQAVAARLAADFPQTNGGLGVHLAPLHEEVVGEVRPALLVLFGAVGLVLLVACANVAHLLLARAVSRRREMAVRSALGASRARLIRQLLTEGLLLAGGGGVLGVLLALWGVDLLVALAPAELPRAAGIGVDGRVLGFAAAVTLATGLLFGIVPAFRAAGGGQGREQLGNRQQTAGPGTSRARRLLVMAEVGLSVILLVGAGLLLRSFSRLLEVNPGFAAQQVLTADLSLPGAYAEPQQRSAFFEALLERLRAMPGVRAAGVTSHLPLSGEEGSRTFRLQGEALAADEKLATGFRRVGGGYFEALAIPLLRGRALSERDGAGTPGAVLVNEAFARRYFPGQDPLGRTLLLDEGPPRPREIVGVVGDVRHSALGAEPRPELYVSHQDRPWPNMTLVVRADAAAEAFAGQLRRAVAAIDPELPISNVGTMQQQLSRSVARERFSTLVLSLFAGVALVLAALGIHGVLAWSVAERTQEIGIRMALGARREDVLRLVVRQGMAPVLAGLALGLGGSLLLGPLLRGLLYGIAPQDPGNLVAVVVLLGAVALVACAAPARRASRVAPMIALRHD